MLSVPGGSVCHAAGTVAVYAVRSRLIRSGRWARLVCAMPSGLIQFGQRQRELYTMRSRLSSVVQWADQLLCVCVRQLSRQRWAADVLAVPYGLVQQFLSGARLLTVWLGQLSGFHRTNSVQGMHSRLIC